MHKHLNSWKNSTSAFYQQLSRNRYELNNNFPPHWKNFVKTVLQIKPNRIVDIGCGVGAYCVLADQLDVDYIGYDYAQQAVDIATENWAGNFVCKSYQDITEKDIMPKDLIVANAICDILPTGDQCFEHLLSLGADNVLVQRVRLTDKKSYFTEYEAYDLTTYEFYHNENHIDAIIKTHGYQATKLKLYENIFDVTCIRN
jgi:trans-aconitate methyltransferase